MLLSFKDHGPDPNSTENHVSTFCDSLIDIISDELIDEKPLKVSERLCSKIGEMEQENTSICGHNKGFEKTVLIWT